MLNEHRREAIPYGTHLQSEWREKVKEGKEWSFRQSEMAKAKAASEKLKQAKDQWGMCSPKGNTYRPVEDSVLSLVAVLLFNYRQLLEKTGDEAFDEILGHASLAAKEAESGI